MTTRAAYLLIALSLAAFWSAVGRVFRPLIDLLAFGLGQRNHCLQAWQWEQSLYTKDMRA